MGIVRNIYTAKEKLCIIAYAEAHGNCATGREFSLREWHRLKDRPQKLPKQKKPERGKSAKFPDFVFLSNIDLCLKNMNCTWCSAQICYCYLFVYFIINSAYISLVVYTAPPKESSEKNCTLYTEEYSNYISYWDNIFQPRVKIWSFHIVSCGYTFW